MTRTRVTATFLARVAGVSVKTVWDDVKLLYPLALSDSQPDASPETADTGDAGLPLDENLDLMPDAKEMPALRVRRK